MKSILHKYLPLLTASIILTMTSFGSATETVHPEAQTIELELLPGEYWWGGLSVDGYLMPYHERTQLKRNLYGNNAGNQASPILVSSKGRYVW